MNSEQMIKDQFFVDFKNAFLKSDFFKTFICKNHDVYLISIGGSTGSAIDITESDYDIDVFITDEPKLGEETEVGFYKGKKFHWYYWSLNKLQYLANLSETTLYKNARYLFGSLYGMAMLSFDKIIWQDNNQSDLVQKTELYIKKFKSKAAALFLAASKKDFLKVIKFCSNFPVEIDIPVWDPRYFYRLFTCYKIATQGRLTAEDKDFIFKVRQIKSMPEMPADIRVVIKQLCLQCLANNPYTWEIN